MAIWNEGRRLALGASLLPQIFGWLVGSQRLLWHETRVLGRAPRVSVTPRGVDGDLILPLICEKDTIKSHLDFLSGAISLATQRLGHISKRHTPGGCLRQGRIQVERTLG